MEREAWWATVGPQSMRPQSQTGLSAHISIAMRDFDIEMSQMGKKCGLEGRFLGEEVIFCGQN